MSDHGNLIVFFAVGPALHLNPLKYIRLLRRKPGVARQVFVGALIRILAPWECGHVAIGYRGGVLDPQYEGNRFYAIDAFAAEYPDIRYIFEVPARRPVDLDAFEPDQRKRVWPSIARRLTLGRWPWADDCICTVLMAINLAGVPTPHNIHTPRQLYKWLVQQGYTYVSTK